MKKRLSIIASILILSLTVLSNSGCNSTSQKNNQSQQSQEVVKNVSASSDVTVYYFHATRRCATCQAVEEVTKEVLSDSYGEDVAFKSINREEQKDHPLIKKHNISGQTLLIVKGDKSEDLTNVAFMNARTKPEKLKSKIRETIGSL
jgi:hypothetical protein